MDMETSEIELLYDEYLKRDDLIIIQDDKEYYRIVRKYRISCLGGIVNITVPRTVFKNARDNLKLMDENGSVFSAGASVHFSFRGGIPQWYLETVTISLKEITDIELIGNYISELEL